MQYNSGMIKANSTGLSTGIYAQRYKLKILLSKNLIKKIIPKINRIRKNKKIKKVFNSNLKELIRKIRLKTTRLNYKYIGFFVIKDITNNSLKTNYNYLQEQNNCLI